MWTFVSGGSHNLWVKTDECRLPNGELAFVDDWGPAPSSPDWFVGPEGSELQMRQDGRKGGECLWEFRSMRASAEYVLAFYQDLIEKAGLAILPERKPERLCPGFRAKSAEFGFHVYVYERKGLSFWNIGLDTENYKKRKWVPRYLQLLGQNDERVILRTTGVRPIESWAPIDALRDTDPSVERQNTCSIYNMGTIRWSSLPKWIQFNVEDGKQGEITSWEDEDGSKGWNANVSTKIEGNPRNMFESCLNDLEAQGYEMRGIEGPEKGFSISLLGDWPTAHVQSENGDGGMIRLDDSQCRWKSENQWDIHFVYLPVSGTPLSKFIDRL
ncbi:MAG: hypothetical protein WAN35_07520 [Terracidiphilus sp.]